MRRHTRRLVKILTHCGIVPSKGAEIGVFMGNNAVGLLDTFPDLHLVLVDSYELEQRGATVEDVQIVRRMKRVQKKAKVRFIEYEDRILWKYKPSVEAAKEIENESLDYVFIDAEHTYEAVSADIEAWLPKIRKDGRGLISGHDYVLPKYQGLVRAVHERFGERVKNIRDVWYINLDEFDKC